MFAADVLHRCPCGWGVSDLCILPEEVCQQGRTVLRSISTEDSEDSLLASGISKITAWETLCAAPFKAVADIVDLLQMLKHLPDILLRSCSAREVSVVWGLLAPEEYTTWYAGENGNWSVNPQHLATTGPGGLHIGILSEKAPAMQEYVRIFPLGETVDGIVNMRYKHTIAQPVCNSTLQMLLREELEQYFVNTRIPMAHSVQIVPAVEYCKRWVIEYAMFKVLEHAMQHESDLRQGEEEQEEEEKLQRMRVLVAEQQALAEEWRDKCSVQMLDMGICSLRGVYDIIPPTATIAPNHCAFAGQSVTGCALYYYNSSCLLFCDGVFFDPCL
jgi:hypothetical protein